MKTMNGRRNHHLSAFGAPIAVALSMCLSASPASADENDAITVGYQPAWYALAGATGGASFGSTDNGGYAGAEVSVVRLLGGWWHGLYIDALYDFGTRTPHVSLGPEFGWWVFGVDGGAGVRTAEDDGLEIGPQVRGLFTFGLLSFYYRHAFWPHASTNRTVRQAGLMLKVPLGSPWGTGPTSPWDLGRRSER